MGPPDNLPALTKEQRRKLLEDARREAKRDEPPRWITLPLGCSIVMVALAVFGSCGVGAVSLAVLAFRRAFGV